MKIVSRLFVLLPVLGLAAACGGSSGGNSAEQTSSGKATPPTVKLTVAEGIGAGFPNAALAQSLGYFKAEGLDVKILSTDGDSRMATVVSGRAQVGAYTLLAPILASKQGHNMTEFYAYQGEHSVGALVSRKGITSLEQLKALPNCKLATENSGSSFYGYMQSWIKALGLHCKVTQFSSGETMLGGVVAGHYDAADDSLDDVIPVVKKGKINMLVDPRNRNVIDGYLGQGFPTNAWFAPTDWAKTHKDVLVRLLRAFDKADQALRTMTPEQLGKALHDLPDPAWKATSADDYAAEFSAIRYSLNPNRGYISEADWTRAFKSISNWGVSGFSATDPASAYAARVDMSYYDAAIGKPATGS
jgi:NitT/TauT family transport system substrate-binding protein